MTAEHTRLTASLRELRARTGLSLAALAERTTYSKSSWERYLNGKAMPPRQAVQDLCRIAGEPEGRLLALREIAESTWSGRAATPAPPVKPSAPPAPEPAGPSEGGGEPQEGKGPRPRHWGRLVLVLAAACAVTVAGVALTLLLPGSGTGSEGKQPPPSVSGSAPTGGPTTRCRGAACEGKDPLGMVCGIAPQSIATHHTAAGADMEVRYSRQCGAAWARMWGARIGDRVDIKGSGPAHEAVITDRMDAESYVFTEMATARPGDALRFCFHPKAEDEKCECVETTVKK